TIPVVFVTGADPIKFGFVASFNRPDGNVTGIWIVTTVLAQKRLQLVREMLPKAELIALLVNPTSPVAEPQTRDAQAAADALGLKLSVLSAVTENDFENPAGRDHEARQPLFAPAAHQWGKRQSAAIEGDQGRSVGDRHSQAAAAAGCSGGTGEQDGAHRLGRDAAPGAIPA